MAVFLFYLQSIVIIAEERKLESILSHPCKRLDGQMSLQVAVLPLIHMVNLLLGIYFPLINFV